MIQNNITCAGIETQMDMMWIVMGNRRTNGENVSCYRTEELSINIALQTYRIESGEYEYEMFQQE